MALTRFLMFVWRSLEVKNIIDIFSIIFKGAKSFGYVGVWPRIFQTPSTDLNQKAIPCAKIQAVSSIGINLPPQNWRFKNLY